MRTISWKITLLFFMMFTVSMAPAAAQAWTKGAIDAPKVFSEFYSRAIAIDGIGNPHISYGEDHLYYAYHNGSIWKYETVDTSTGVGQYASIAIDPLNKVHISYYDWVNGYLKYATNASGSWVITILDSSADVGGNTAIAIDSLNKVHISYYDWDNFYLKYATNVSGSWVVTTVDSTGDVGLYSSIAIDSLDKVHISYYDYDNDHLKYATNASGPWVTATLDSSGTVGMYTSIAIDSSNKMHISYYDWSAGDLKYATNASGSWVSVTVDSSGTVGLYASIVIDSFNDVHISYNDDTNDDLKYATNSGVASGAGTCVNTDWDCGAVDTPGVTGLYTSLAVDASDVLHISYYNSSIGDLKYATNASGSWIDEVVDSSGDAGLFTSIAKDSSNKVHISYYDDKSGDLKYITNASGPWVVSTLASVGTVGKYSSIAIDPSDKVHISYYNNSNGDLNYITNATGSWVAELVDGVGIYAGSYTSIAIDSSYNVHISYYDGTNGNLKYATNSGVNSGAGNCFAGLNFDCATVDSSVDVGTDTSIAIDSLDKVHISYYDWENGDLRYTTNRSVAPGMGNCSNANWDCEMVDGQGDVGENTSIAIDSLDKVHISYYKFSQLNLKYVTNASGSWVDKTVDSKGDVGLYTSIAIDSMDNAHISYYDWDNGDLKYANNSSGSWVDETVDSDGAAGLYTSIDIDSSDNVHISYYDYDNGDLKYATTAPVHILTVNAGTEGGSVSPDCAQGCWYASGTIVLLTAEADPGYVFAYWTGCDSPSGNICTMTVDASKNVTATFEQCSAPVRIVGDTTEYYSLQDAYDAALNNDIIQSQELIFIEDLFIDDPVNKTVTIEGGYDCHYSAVTGETVMQGGMVISNGEIIIQTGTFKVQQ